MDDIDFIDLPDDGGQASPPPPVSDTPAPPAMPRKRIFAPTPAKVNRYERRDRERDDRRGRPIEADGHYAPPHGRVPPHSAQAEEVVLSCCFIDGNDSVARCLDGKIKPETFYVPANRILFEVFLALYNAKRPIDLPIVAQELMDSRRLDEMGGYAYLTRIEGTRGTTASLGEMIAKVKELATLRDIINAATNAVEDCYGYTGDLAQIIERINDANRIIDDATTPVSSLIRPLDTFTYPLNDPDCLIGAKGRYLGRGGSLLIPAPAGIGKSTASYQMAACWGTGRDFLGMAPVGALRILIVQVEDDDGDVGEMFTSVQQGLGLNQREQAMIRQNVAVVRDRVSIGEHFGPALRRYVRHHRPDIVIINPLMRYCPGLSKEEIAGPFLSSLDALADEFGFACVAFHHTPKPPVQDGSKGKPAKKDAVDRQYTAFGSSALTNWPRAIINIAKVRGHDGVFVFQFDKRGKRAGITRPVPSGNFEETVTELVVQHSQRTMTVGGRTFPMVLWEIHENQDVLNEAEEAEAGSPRREGKAPKNFKRTYTEQEFIGQFPFGMKAAKPLPVICRQACSNLGITPAKFNDEKFHLYVNGFIQKVTMETGQELYFR